MTANMVNTPHLHDIFTTPFDKDLVIQLSLNGFCVAFHQGNPKIVSPLNKDMLLISTRGTKPLSIVRLKVKDVKASSLRKQLKLICKPALNEVTHLKEDHYFDEQLKLPHQYYFIRKFDPEYFNSIIRTIQEKHEPTMDEDLKTAFDNFPKISKMNYDFNKPELTKINQFLLIKAKRELYKKSRIAKIIDELEQQELNA